MTPRLPDCIGGPEVFRAFVGFSEPGLVYVRLSSSSRGARAASVEPTASLGPWAVFPFWGVPCSAFSERALGREKVSEQLDAHCARCWRRCFHPTLPMLPCSRCVCPVVGLTGVVPLCGGAAHAWLVFAV